MIDEVKKWIIKAENDLKVAKNEIEIKDYRYNMFSLSASN